jgi:hypothetical protein
MKNLDKLMDFYNKKMGVTEFVDLINSDKELQDFLNDIKEKDEDNNETPVEEINVIYNIRFTTLEHKDSSIRATVRDRLRELKDVSILSDKDIEQFVIDELLCENAFWGAGEIVEDYIRHNILIHMPKIKKIKDGAKFVKAELPNHFKCDKRMPSWLQNCEWPFDSSGQPMIFKSSKTTNEGNTVREYYFYSLNGEAATIEQAY